MPTPYFTPVWSSDAEGLYKGRLPWEMKNTTGCWIGAANNMPGKGRGKERRKGRGKEGILWLVCLFIFWELELYQTWIGARNTCVYCDLFIYYLFAYFFRWSLSSSLAC